MSTSTTGIFFCWYSVYLYLTHIYDRVSAPQGHNKKKGWEENMNAAASTRCIDIDVCSAGRYYFALAYGNDSEQLLQYEERLVPSCQHPSESLVLSLPTMPTLILLVRILL
jgi:hypothetical protein